MALIWFLETGVTGRKSQGMTIKYTKIKALEFDVDEGYANLSNAVVG